MKILHVTKKYPSAIGGDSLVVANLEKCQRAAGHDVLILTTNCDVIDDAPHVRKFGLKDDPASLDAITLKRLLSIPSLIRQLLKILREQKPDVIHSHSPDLGFFVAFIARWRKIPVVHTCHGVTFPDPQYSRAKRSLELFLLKRAPYRHITVLSPSLVEVFAKQGMNHAVFVPNGVDVDFWRPDFSTKKKISKAEPFTFDTVGRLEDQKGFSFLLEACASLRLKGYDFHVNIIGTGSKHDELKALTEKLNLVDFITFMGNKTPAQIRDLHAAARAYVCSSLWEGFPLTILEAWAMELPVVTTRVGSIGEISPEGGSLMVEPADSAGLADAMERILDPENAGQLAQMVAINRAACLQTYNWPTIAQTLEELYAK